MFGLKGDLEILGFFNSRTAIFLQICAFFK